MKVIIAGGREVTDYNLVIQAISECSFEITEIVSGGARGVDTMAIRYAEENGFKVKIFMAEWHNHGKAAGPIRNALMAKYADALVALWDGKSKGTKNMIEQAVKHGLRVYVKRI